jgi:hypothetical protein
VAVVRLHFRDAAGLDLTREHLLSDPPGAPFFQSCHGKGPSDSEGAAVKCSLKRHELLGEYFADTDAAYRWLEEHLTKVAPKYPVAGPVTCRSGSHFFQRPFQRERVGWLKGAGFQRSSQRERERVGWLKEQGFNSRLRGRQSDG